MPSDMSGGDLEEDLGYDLWDAYEPPEDYEDFIEEDDDEDDD